MQVYKKCVERSFEKFCSFVDTGTLGEGIGTPSPSVILYTKIQHLAAFVSNKKLAILHFSGSDIHSCVYAFILLPIIVSYHYIIKDLCIFKWEF